MEAPLLGTWEGVAVDEWRAHWHVPELHIYSTIPSTNDVVRARAEAGAPAGTTVIAEHQSSGRGRRSRRWDAPPGAGLLMSMLYRPRTTSPADLAGTIPLRTGLAIAAAIEETCNIAVCLKWPNDVVTEEGRKIAGILCESSLTISGVSYTVTGVGINVRQTEDQLHDDGSNRAASLRTLTGRDVDRAALAGAVIRALLRNAAEPAAPLSPAELQEFARRDALASHTVTADGTPVGTAAGISERGELQVEDGTGVRAIHAATVRRVT